jgi:hypothetical protein
MWMLSIIPEAKITLAIHALFAVTLVGIIVAWFLSLIPPFKGWATILKYVFIVGFLGALFLEGGIQNEKKWLDRVAELEEKVKASEEKSREVNTVIQTKYVEKIKKVKEVEFQIVEKIKEVEKVIDAKCELDPSVISILNEAARGAK